MLSEPAKHARQRVLLAVEGCGWVHLDNSWGEPLFGRGAKLPVFAGKLRIKLIPESGETLVEVKVRCALTPARADRAVTDVLAKLGQEQARTSELERAPGRVERGAIRILMAVLVIGSVTVALQIGIPKKTASEATGSTGQQNTKVVKENDLPAPAAGETGLYRLEVGLGVFFGGLLLLTPAFVGIIRGRLPMEMSLRGWKFGEEAVATDKVMQESIRKIETRLDIVEPDLTRATLRIKQLGDHADLQP
jgi:hypothetical protein